MEAKQVNQFHGLSALGYLIKYGDPPIQSWYCRAVHKYVVPPYLFHVHFIFYIYSGVSAA